MISDEHNNVECIRKVLKVVTTDDHGLNSEFQRASLDHEPLEALGLPFIYFESTNWNYGEQVGYTQVEPKYCDSGEIWYKELDTFEYLEKTFPGRITQRLELFSTVLYKLLIQGLSDI